MPCNEPFPKLQFCQYNPTQKPSLKPTAVASVASRVATRRGEGGFAAEACTPPQERKKGNAQFLCLARRELFLKQEWTLPSSTVSKKVKQRRQTQKMRVSLEASHFTLRIPQRRRLLQGFAMVMHFLAAPNGQFHLHLTTGKVHVHGHKA